MAVPPCGLRVGQAGFQRRIRAWGSCSRPSVTQAAPSPTHQAAMSHPLLAPGMWPQKSHRRGNTGQVWVPSGVCHSVCSVGTAGCGSGSCREAAVDDTVVRGVGTCHVQGRTEGRLLGSGLLPALLLGWQCALHVIARVQRRSLLNRTGRGRGGPPQ